jgi:hypothetical protein
VVFIIYLHSIELNDYCEPVNKYHSYNAAFKDEDGNIWHKLYNVNRFTTPHMVKIRVEMLHRCINKQTDIIDNTNFTQITYLDHWDIRCQQICSLRKLESFLIQYDGGYVRKPAYKGENGYKVNT